MSLSPYRAGTKVSDFYSINCNEIFQLKSLSRPFSNSILGSEYHTTLTSVEGGTHPSLILLHYDRPKATVQDLSLIHRACITPSCIVARRPLAPSAKRAGWQGCTISVERIPELGRIKVISEGRIIRDKSSVLHQWKRSESLLKTRPANRGWLADVLRCVKRCSLRSSLLSTSTASKRSLLRIIRTITISDRKFDSNSSYCAISD